MAMAAVAITTDSKKPHQMYILMTQSKWIMANCIFHSEKRRLWLRLVSNCSCSSGGDGMSSSRFFFP